MYKPSDALSNILIPDAQNAELKSLLQSGLKIFQDHRSWCSSWIEVGKANETNAWCGQCIE
jgi:predicted outer membrane protein